MVEPKRWSEAWWQVRADAGRCVHSSKSNDGGRCRRAAISGGTVCPQHGGSAGHVKAAAARRVQRGQAEAGIARIKRLGLAPGQELVAVHPAAAMLEALALAHADMHLYAWICSELEEGGLSVELLSPVTGDPTGEARRHIYIEMYEQAQARVAAIAAQCIKAKVSESAAEAVKEEAQAMSELCRSLALALGHSPAEPQVRDAMRTSLALVRANQQAANTGKRPAPGNGSV
jgi:hypothetical protein